MKQMQSQVFHEHDIEKQGPDPVSQTQTIKLSIRDVNPIGPIVLVLKRINNIVVLIASGQFSGT